VRGNNFPQLPQDRPRVYQRSPWLDLVCGIALGCVVTLGTLAMLGMLP
jgi:hypothetical protein